MRLAIKTIVFLLLLITVCQNVFSVTADSPVPIVLWHGMGDSCCSPFSLGAIKTILEDEIPGVYVKSLQIGNNQIEDIENGYFKNVNDQIIEACDEVSNDKLLQNGYNAIGFSQGGQFLRALAQRCPKPRMLKLLSLGGQHQGVFGLPHCGSLKHRLCDSLRKLLHYGAYLKYIQSRLVQAEYWHDPLREDEYKKKSIFLADINNEIIHNKEYKDNLMKLKMLVLLKFENDTMVQPRESEWFGFYKPGQAVELQTLQESALYTEDRLGLREMDKLGKIHFLSVEGNHLQFTDVWFIDNIIKKYLL